MGRPFMGPNLYITPPGSYTIFHQDGHGTVDSGHLCLSGYNEVIILRRLTETHKKNAMKILNGNDYPVDDALYHLPHAERTVSRCLISASTKHALQLQNMLHSTNVIYTHTCFAFLNSYHVN